MAQRVVTTLIDDLDGGVADETFRFGLDGADLEIDLSTANAEKLRGILAPYAAKARRVGRTAASSGSKAYPAPRVAKATVTRSPLGAEIRAWAASEMGQKVLSFHDVPPPSAKGRFSSAIGSLYQDRATEELRINALEAKRAQEAQATVTAITKKPRAPRSKAAAATTGGENAAQG